MTAPSRPPNRVGRQLLIALVFGVVVFAGMSFYGDVQALGDNLRRYQWSFFAGGLGLATLNYAIRFVRWEYYLRVLDVRDVPVAESARIFVAGFVMSVTPGKVGEVFKSVLLYESRNIPIAHTAPIVVAERLTDLLALVVLAAIGSLTLAQGAGVAIGGAVLVVVIWLACAWRPFGELLLRITESMPVVKALVPKLREAYSSLNRLVAPRPLGVASVLALISWFTECAALWLIARGFPDVTIGWLEAIFAYSVPTIIGAVAMLPGGLGVTEASMTGILQRVAPMSATVGTATTLLVRLATLWWAVLLGLIALGLQRRAQRGNDR